ncbi:2'-5' RNA ligase family protein [Paenibacillus larvae]|nr:2'-5' RNA ligase family protein [Paenibacillus larvae]MDT2275403.1 2'-5' RNA ligase family protein [Paenibacillus larvae]
MRGGTGRLEQLQAEIENAVEAFGFLPEARPYRPHLTVARRYQGKSAFRAEALELDLPRDRPAVDSKGNNPLLSTAGRIPDVPGNGTVRAWRRAGVTSTPARLKLSIQNQIG